MGHRAGHKRALAGLLSAQAVSFTGTRMSLVAIPWFVLDITGSAAALGLVAFAEGTPLVVAKALSGPVIDRYGPRRVSVVADVIAAGAMGTIPVLQHTGGLQLAVLVGLAAVVGAARGPGDSAKAAMVPGVAEASGTVLERAAGLAGAIDRLSQMIGPPIAGGLVAAFGPAAVVSVDAATFAAAAVIVATTLRGGLHLAGREVDAADPAEAGALGPESGYLGQLRTGLGFLWRERLLRSLVAMMAMTNLIDAAVVSVLLALWARQSGAGPTGMGLVLGVFGGMAVGGSVIAAAVGHRLRRRPTYLAGQVISGAPRIALLAVGTPLGGVVAVWAIAGFASGFLNPIIGAVTYERIPRPMLGRVLTLGGTAAQGGIPIGPVVAGGLVTGLGLAPVALLCAAAYFATTTLPLRRPEWREMDRTRRRPERRAPAATGRDGEDVARAVTPQPRPPARRRNGVPIALVEMERTSS